MCTKESEALKGHWKLCVWVRLGSNSRGPAASLQACHILPTSVLSSGWLLFLDQNLHPLARASEAGCQRFRSRSGRGGYYPSVCELCSVLLFSV